MRLALAAMSPAPMTFTTREGFTVALPTRDQVRPLVMVLAAVGVVPDRVVRVEPVDDAAHLVAPGAVRRQRSRCSATTPAFYVFTLPALELLRGFLLGLIVLAAIGVGGAVFRRRPGGADAVRPARRGSRAPHLTWLAAAFFLVLALGAWLSRVQEIVMPSGIIQGASYADAHARMPAALALTVAGAGRRRPRRRGRGDRPHRVS